MLHAIYSVQVFFDLGVNYTTIVNIHNSVYLQVLEKEHPNATLDNSIDRFKFIQPKGTLKLLLKPPQQLGWTVHPERKPMKVCM